MQETRSFSLARLGAVLLVLLAVASFARVAPASAQEDSITIDLDELNDSGVSGTATLTDNGDGTTTVSIQVDGASGDHPAHIHEGTCDDLNPNPEYPLNNVDAEGISETDVEVALDDLLAEPHAVNLHLSADNVATYIACGNIEGAAGGETPTETPTETASGNGTGATTPPSTGVGQMAGSSTNAALLAGLAAIALALVGGGVVLRRRELGG